MTDFSNPLSALGARILELPSFTSTRSAASTIGAASQALTNLRRDMEVLAQDRTMTEAGQLARVATLTTRRLSGQPAQLAAGARAAASAALTAMEKLKAAERVPIEERHLAPEIRAHVRGLDLHERVAFMAEATKNADLPTLRAVVEVPGFLTQVSPQMLDLARAKIHEIVAPDAVAEAEAAQAAAEMLLIGEKLIKDELDRGRSASALEFAAKAANAAAVMAGAA